MRTLSALPLVVAGAITLSACESDPAAASSSSSSSTSGGPTSADGGGSSSGGSSSGGSSSGGSSSGGGVDAGADAGPSGSALRFDGIDDVVSATFPAETPSETSFSAETWFRTTAQGGMLVEVYSASPVGADRSLYVKDGKVCFYVYGAKLSSVCSTAAVNDGQWHHVAGTLGTAGQKLFVDGVAAAEDAAVTSSSFTYEKAVRFGYGYLGALGVLTYFAGDLDEVRLWNVERTPAEIAGARSATIAPSTAGLYGYWRLDEPAAATDAKSAKGDGFDGTLSGFSPPSWVPGAL